MLIRQQTRWLFRKGGCGTFDEDSEKFGDGGFADESGEEYEDVRENLRSVGFGKNPKGDRSFFIPAYLPSF